jgi:perosamine synthetase
MTQRMIPYGRQCLDEEDIQRVVEVLHSDWLTTGPMVEKFEQAVADFVCSKYAVAVSSGTAALHAAMAAVGIGPGDEVIVPTMTFAATANAVVFQGGHPVFVDVLPSTLLINPSELEAKITSKTKALIAVDYAGQPCDYDALRAIADKHRLILIADACHSLGAEYKGRKVGTLADLTVFSFHPVKHITTGEGGMVVTETAEYAEKMRRFRNHGIPTDHRQRAEVGTWFYEMTDLGYNYRLTDFQCALGLSQLQKLPNWIARRREIARKYDLAFATFPGIKPLDTSLDVAHSYHLYVIQLVGDQARGDRAVVFETLRKEGIGVNVHYVPVHLHPFYRERFATHPGMCPVAEAVYEHILSLPIFPSMEDREVREVIETVRRVVGR